MTGESEEFVAKTAAGVPIRKFADRAQALAWAETEGDRFPGWVIQVQTTITIVRTRTVRKDRSLERTA